MEANPWGFSSRIYTDGLLMQERKEKLGEKITTLQQLVSPYGKVRNISLSLKTRILEFEFFIKMLSYGLYMESYAD